ncbi:MAG: Mur ligase, partial [Gammaproteobacteria bacterium]|nr:Mur ligase [Gammaproteobacteria bacterium]
MEYLDARRITGPSLLWNRAGSILDIGCCAAETDDVVRAWEAAVRHMLTAVGWGDESTCHWRLQGGVSLAFSAPIDALYAASEINEWAWLCLQSGVTAEAFPDLDTRIVEIRRLIEEEVNPALLQLEAAAGEHGVAFLWDDDDVSVGLGTGSETWPFRQLPRPDELDWSRYHDIPVGIVTGTNGKTTTVRLATHVLRGAGKKTGVSCTDWIAVNDAIIERGDWSGPGGARNVLRQKEADIAILETARGGLLRRGLGVTSADVALITNIAEDHLGDFGSRNLQELLDIKWVVSRAVRSAGTLVLNADDERLVTKAQGYAGRIVWFSLDADNTIVKKHVDGGELAFVLDGTALTKCIGNEREIICDDTGISITLNGAARHNTANALAAAALTYCLGTPIEAIRDGLKSVTQADNPGRCNVYEIEDFRVLVDFAHNPHAMQALFDMAAGLPAKRRLLAFAQAGDRPDDLIAELARGAWSIGLDAIIVSELATYHRGRAHGEVYKVIHDELIRCGAHEDQLRHFELEMESLDAALEWAQPGDLVIMLALGDAVAIQEKLK